MYVADRGWDARRDIEGPPRRQSKYGWIEPRAHSQNQPERVNTQGGETRISAPRCQWKYVCPAITVSCSYIPADMCIISPWSDSESGGRFAFALSSCGGICALCRIKDEECVYALCMLSRWMGYLMRTYENVFSSFAKIQITTVSAVTPFSDIVYNQVFKTMQ